jgi:hypothetical protein
VAGTELATGGAGVADAGVEVEVEVVAPSLEAARGELADEEPLAARNR